MSIVNYDNLTPAELISQYILECHGKGTLLSYSDYSIINEWLASALCVDDLLVVLAEIIPHYFARNSDKPYAPTLKGVRKKVLRKLKILAQRQPLSFAFSEGG